jgi:hypothetical protein
VPFDTGRTDADVGMKVERRARRLTDGCYRRSLLRQVLKESNDRILKFDSNIEVPKEM